MDSSASSSKANGQSVIVSEKKDDEVDQLARALSRDFASFLQVDQSNEVGVCCLVNQLLHFVGYLCSFDA